MKEKDHGGTRLTEGASVSVSASEAASHAAHTPGPWDVSSMFVGPLQIKAATGHTVAEVPFEFFQQGEANAHLIAAAPELLEALKRLVDVAKPFNGYGTGGAELEIAKGEALAVIAKAEGRS